MVDALIITLMYAFLSNIKTFIFSHHRKATTASHRMAMAHLPQTKAMDTPQVLDILLMVNLPHLVIILHHRREAILHHLLGLEVHLKVILMDNMALLLVAIILRHHRLNIIKDMVVPQTVVMVNIDLLQGHLVQGIRYLLIQDPDRPQVGHLVLVNTQGTIKTEDIRHIHREVRCLQDQELRVLLLHHNDELNTALCCSASNHK